MAGSQNLIYSPRFADPVLAARLEALQLLAERMCSRVMVVDRDLTIVYANEAGWRAPDERQPDQSPAKCYEAFLHGADPCEVCPATEVFTSGKVRTISCTQRGDGTRCGMHQAYPLMSSTGTVESVLVLFDKGTRGRVQEPILAAPPRDRARREFLWQLIGESAPMRELSNMIRLVAHGLATVLLQGESGTGKELVARLIHRLSVRRDRSFVVVDCGSLPETLLETELFGHVRGAFTGALSNKKGLFEEADGGTIFLDEIADTSPHFQSKLLRVVQEGEIKPVGSSRSIKVDVRIVSATNRSLLHQVRTGAFREDLYYRLSVLPLCLPPLRERREDIPLLVRHFAEVSCQRHKKPLMTVGDDAMHALLEAPWPGNIRQLQHLIERVVVTAPGQELTPEDFFGQPPALESPTDLRSVAGEAKSQAERARILEALRRTDGNRAKAARALKISRASLYNKLRVYGIE